MSVRAAVLGLGPLFAGEALVVLVTNVTARRRVCFPGPQCRAGWRGCCSFLIRAFDFEELASYDACNCKDVYGFSLPITDRGCVSRVHQMHRDSVLRIRADVVSFVRICYVCVVSAGPRAVLLPSATRGTTAAAAAAASGDTTPTMLLV